jgi:hypothetical protein
MDGVLSHATPEIQATFISECFSEFIIDVVESRFIFFHITLFVFNQMMEVCKEPIQRKIKPRSLQRAVERQ